MSTTIAGNDLSYTIAQLLNTTGELIIRTPTADSSDNFGDSATNIILGFLGTANASYNGNSFRVTIQNNSGFTITQTCTGVDVTMEPSSTLIIPPDSSATFQFLQETPTTVTVYIENSGTIFGPVLSTDNSIMRFNGTTGLVAQGSAVTIDDLGNLTGIADLTAVNFTATNSIIIEDPGVGTNTITLTAPTLGVDYTLTLPPNDGTTGQILTTDGTGITTWQDPPAALNSSFSAYGPAVSTTVSTAATVIIATTTVTDTNYTLTTGVVTVTAAGDYLISYTAQFQTLDQTGGRDASFAGRLLIGGIAQAGSTTECHVSENNGDLIRPSVSKTMILPLGAGATVALEVERTVGTTTAQTRADQCTLVIRRFS